MDQFNFNHSNDSDSAHDEDLRLLILSTPKTGNTWLARLLSAVYDLPQLGLVLPFDLNQARSLGKRWVVFHHARPSPEILEWIEETKPVLLTAVRHPADVLVSLYYHLREFKPDAIDARAMREMLTTPFARYDILSDSTGSFQDDLECSLSWVRIGTSIVVRYEDLWRDVHRELIRVTSLIRPVSERRIRLAIERCDFSLMRRLAGDHGRFFRSGKVGSWLEAVPDEVLLELSRQPYYSLTEELGYSLDRADPMITAPRVPRASINPFKKNGGVHLDETQEDARFENGVPVAPLLVDLYLALCEKYSWDGDPSSSGHLSFFQWLNQPCELVGRHNYEPILITNLALQLHRLRPDLNQTFTDLTSGARADFADWFVRGGAQGVELDPCFVEPVRRSLVEWAGARAPEDREAWAWWPRLPNFALHLYRSSENLRAVYPDIVCFDRWSYLEWIISNQVDANINPEFVEPVRRSLKKLAKLRSVGRYVPGARVRVARAGE